MMNKFKFERGHSEKDLKTVLTESNSERLVKFQMEIRPEKQVTFMPF